MCRKILGVIAACVLMLGLNGCSEQQKQVVRISHTQVESHPAHRALLAFKNHIEKKSQGRYDIQIFPNSTLGADEKVLELIKQGSVQFLLVSSANIEYFDSLYSIYSFPYLFTSQEAYEEYIVSEEVLDRLSVNAQRNGFVPIVAFNVGTRNFYSKTPIYSVTDLQGKKFRVPAGSVNIAMMQAFGATAVPMSFGEVYSALQQGIIDGAANNELALIDQKHGDIAKFYTYDMHQMCPDYLIASNKFLKNMSKEDKKMFKEAAALAQKVEFHTWNDAVQLAVDKAKSKQVKFIEVDVEEFRSHVINLHEQLMAANPELRELYDIAEQCNKNH